MALRYPKTIEVPAKSKTSVQGVVIMLHGLGDSGEGWRDVGPQLQQQLPGIKFVFPTAPERAVTLNNGYRMNAWYDIPTLESINSSEDKEGLLESKRYIEELVAREVAAGTPSTRVLVGGFSQGGAVALLMLRSNVKLAGVMALSTYLPLRDLPGVLSEENKGAPIFMGHGDADRVVSYAFGQQTETRLKGLGADVEFRTYRNMAHSACAEEMKDIGVFLAKVFA
ncbi:MAG: hypothetical protein WDW38_001681 [Sanguina aurantia]